MERSTDSLLSEREKCDPPSLIADTANSRFALVTCVDDDVEAAGESVLSMGVVRSFEEEEGECERGKASLDFCQSEVETRDWVAEFLVVLLVLIGWAVAFSILVIRL